MTERAKKGLQSSRDKKRKAGALVLLWRSAVVGDKSLLSDPRSELLLLIGWKKNRRALKNKGARKKKKKATYSSSGYTFLFSPSESAVGYSIRMELLQ